MKVAEVRTDLIIICDPKDTNSVDRAVEDLVKFILQEQQRLFLSDTWTRDSDTY